MNPATRPSAATSAQPPAAASAEKSPMTATPTKATSTKAPAATIHRTSTVILLRCALPLRVGSGHGARQPLEQLGLHSLGVDSGRDLGRRAASVVGTVQASCGVRVGARLARQPHRVALGDELRSQQRADQRQRIVEVGAVDAIGLLMEADIEAHGVPNDAAQM